jgi:hypothetical protein
LDGDWAWFDIPVTDDGFDLNDRPVALTNELWFLINAFTFHHRELGFTVLEEFVEVCHQSIETPSVM